MKQTPPESPRIQCPSCKHIQPSDGRACTQCERCSSMIPNSREALIDLLNRLQLEEIYTRQRRRVNSQAMGAILVVLSLVGLVACISQFNTPVAAALIVTFGLGLKLLVAG